MLAIECDKCGGTSYTADPLNNLPCPHCGVYQEIGKIGNTLVAKKGARPLNDLDRIASVRFSSRSSRSGSLAHEELIGKE